MKRHLSSLALAAVAGLVIFAAAYLIGAAIGLALIVALLVAGLVAVLVGGVKAAKWRASRRSHRT